MSTLPYYKNLLDPIQDAVAIVHDFLTDTEFLNSIERATYVEKIEQSMRDVTSADRDINEFPYYFLGTAKKCIELVGKLNKSNLSPHLKELLFDDKTAHHLGAKRPASTGVKRVPDGYQSES